MLLLSPSLDPHVLLGVADSAPARAASYCEVLEALNTVLAHVDVIARRVLLLHHLSRYLEHSS